MEKFAFEEIKEFVSRSLFDEKIILNKDPSLPKISIVTPSYNQGKFLERAIMSVLNQKYSNFWIYIYTRKAMNRSDDMTKPYKNILRIG